jgi:pimeloyl-ACP methyl ester carboxylesterase
LALALVSCGPAAKPADEASTTPTNIDESVIWTPCDITTADGTFANAAECTTVQVPVRRDIPTQRKITLSLKRYTRAHKPRAALWLLAGGPGAAASEFEYDSPTYFALATDLELYFLDSRGTGRSTRLACKAEEDPKSYAGTLIRDREWTSCADALTAEWGDDLQAFNTTETARDLGEMIERTRREDTPIFIYAVSYGTFLAERYLVLYRDQPSGVILDSITPPNGVDVLLDYDRHFDAVARELFKLCGLDQSCSTELGQDAFSHVEALSSALESGHCAELGWSKTTMRQLLGFMVSIARLRDYMPAIVRRAERCSDADITALRHFQTFISSLDTQAASFSEALSANITLSELSRHPLPTSSDIRDNVAGLFASKDVGSTFALAPTAWPLYSSAYAGWYSTTLVPMLMLNGTLDAETPLAGAAEFAKNHQGANQHFIAIPYSPHATLTQSLLRDSEQTCGATLARQFLSAPNVSLDLSCLEQVAPLAFDGYPGITEMLLGTNSAWR